MSDTDAHKPHWVTAAWYRPVHNRHCEAAAVNRWVIPCGPKIPCDLPTEPVRAKPFRGFRYAPAAAPAATRCSWEPDWTGVRCYPHTPRWFVGHFWHRPERVRVRDVLRRAAAEYRATGEASSEPEPRQARHSAAWAWD